MLIVADDPLVRAGLGTMLAELEGCTVAGRVSPAADLAAEALACGANVVLWDLGWDPGGTPLARFQAGMEHLAGAEARLPVVVLLPGPNVTVDAWRAGVQGLLLRDAGAGRLAAALAAAAQGLQVVDPELAPGLLPARGPDVDQPAEPLTPRELEVLQLLADGLPNKTIAARLGISEHTVKFHVNAILGKLGVQSRTEAVIHATRLGLVIL